MWSSRKHRSRIDLVTLTMADSAEIAHMNSVNAKSQNANPGVITNGNDELRLA